VTVVKDNYGHRRAGDSRNLPLFARELLDCRMAGGGFYSLMVRSLMRSWFRLTRSMTIGVRAMVTDDQGRVLLIRPSYLPGWTFPGGGLERGETAAEALARELHEEAAVTIKGEPKLFGFYSNERDFRGDHVLLYVVREFEVGAFVPTLEIKEAQFFNLQDLPADVSKGTRRRIEEVTKEQRPAASW
jgi:ADP-ribose pyrophosphatase YjhB (NUDIX family)